MARVGLGPGIRKLRWDGSSRSEELTQPSVVVLLWHVDVQQPVHGLHVCLSWINFFRQDMDGKYVWPGIPFADTSGMTAKNDQAASSQAQNRGHLRISRALKKKVKFRHISIKVIVQEFLLCRHPVLEVEAVLAATFLKNLICAFSDRRLYDLLVPILTALDSDYPIVDALSNGSVHTAPLDVFISVTTS